VVNLFSYNGGFSVAAALGGAKHVTSVDLAGPAIEDARENFRLNGLDPRAHEFCAADAFTWAAPPSDLVIVDPPSLTHAAKADQAARGAYKALHRHVGTYATDLVASSSCTARLSFERWEEAVREGLGGAWSSLHRSAEPLDHPVAVGHPEGRYLKFALYGRLGGG
jgi:23S rRNA (cytosine1962-C5)-methyltransferase